MPKILNYNSSSVSKNKSDKQNFFVSVWELIQSQDKFAKFSFLTLLLIIVASPFIVSGYLIFNPHAAVQSLLSIEAEDAAISGNASIGSDSNASGGQYIQFGSGGSVNGPKYYVDCVSGSDTNNGMSDTAPWKTLSKANNATLFPGDRLLLKRDCTWAGPLMAKWNGTDIAPITISAYGSGNLPAIKNTESSGNVVQITGSYQIIEYIEISNDSPATIAMDPAKCPPGSPQVGGQVLQPKGWRAGFRLAPASHHNTIQYSKAHENTTGVSMTYNSHHNKIFNNEFTNNTYMSQLTVGGDDDGGAAGIILNGDDNEIAYNYFSGNNACTYDYGPDGISIEVYGAKRNNIHHNRTVNDYSFVEEGTNNEGPTKIPPTPIIYSEDTTVAYNLYTSNLEGSNFLNTRGSGNFGPVYRTNAYNNTAYLPSAGSQGVICSTCIVGGTAILTLKNNILWAAWKAIYSDVSLGDNESNNLYQGQYIQIPSTSPTSLKNVDPKFVALGSDFHLQQTSPAVNVGTSVSCVDCSIDLDKVSVPVGTAVDIGVYEYNNTLPSVFPTPQPCPILPTDMGVATANMDFNAGTYKIWSRIMTPDSSNNSYWLQIDNECGINVGDSSITPGAWTWVDYKDADLSNKTTVNLTAGIHTIKLIGKEAGLKLDRLVLTTDQSCLPQGTGDNCITIPTPIPTTAPTIVPPTSIPPSPIPSPLPTSTPIPTPVPGDTTAPSISVTFPLNGAILTRNKTITITAFASDNVGISKVEFYVNGTLTCTDTASPYACSWKVPGKPNASFTISAKAYDLSNNSSTGFVNVKTAK